MNTGYIWNARSGYKLKSICKSDEVTGTVYQRQPKAKMLEVESHYVFTETDKNIRITISIT